MNSPLKHIDNSELTDFKLIVKQWLNLDILISDREKEIRLLKKQRNKELEPKIIEFMRKHNVSDLNTENGKLKCVEKIILQSFNKKNIKENLSEFLEQDKLEEAMNKIVSNRENKVTHKLTKSKK